MPTINHTHVWLGNIKLCKNDAIELFINGQWREGYVLTVEQNVDDSLSIVSFKLNGSPGQIIAKKTDLMAYEFPGILVKYRIYHHKKPPDTFR